MLALRDILDVCVCVYVCVCVCVCVYAYVHAQGIKFFLKSDDL